LAKKEFNKKVFAGKFVLILVIGIILGISCLFSSSIESFLGIGYKATGYVESEVIAESDLIIHYIDVGQGDATYIELPDGTDMLIDTGTSSGGKHVVEYLQSLEVTQIDYFILTHSDSDHSGGAKRVLDTFEVKRIYRPFQISINKNTGSPSEYEMLKDYYQENTETCNIVDTATYEKFITGAYTETYTENGTENNADVWVFYDGIVINSTDSTKNFTFEFFAPLIRSGSEAFDISTKTTGYPTKFYGKTSSVSKNNSSPVMLLEYKDKSFMFTGDATETVEEDFLASLNADERVRFENIDVFQAGHHGAAESNSQELIDLIKPDYVVVSVGEGNTYGHPTEEFLSRINSYTHEISDYLLRTDNLGDITFGFDSEGKLAYSANDSGEGVTIYWWQIALGLFIVITIIIISVKVTTNKKATAKRVVQKTKQVTRLYKK